MVRIGIDTNIVVRAIVKDELQQAQISLSVLQERETYICHTVILETVWVLESVYKLSKVDIIKGLKLVFGLPKVFLEDSGAIALTLRWYYSGLDFGDALHLATAQRYKTFYTFDKALIKKAKEIPQIKVVEPSSGK
ncbi:type II toxin-antitoxin system VapC family toxin [Myxosarcina sp. GI1]|uniref:type II toxin-antitoxin system VapC family toxin n=1 Tax=Myxosarcina sp. GI1 TaxID=1541065 RepID=UPI000565DF3F|nr:type II toxin-antitoxin system VapC family toxin [Myxosarcina sp. GI1]